MSHHTPVTTLATESMEKPMCNSAAPSVPRPPVANHRVDLKEPDILVGVKDGNDKLERPEENVNPVDKSEHEPVHIKETFVEESISVTETISDEVIEENVGLDNREPETVAANEVEKLEDRKSVV